MKDYDNDEIYIQLNKKLDELCDYRSQGKNVQKKIEEIQKKINNYTGKKIYKLKSENTTEVKKEKWM